AGAAILNFFTVCRVLTTDSLSPARMRLLIYTASSLHVVQCTKRGQLNKRYARMFCVGMFCVGMSAPAVAADCRSRPTPLVGKSNDLITTGTAPEVSRMAPMSM